MVKNDTYAEEKAREGKAIMKWLLKASIVLAIIAALNYWLEADLTVIEIIGSFLCIAVFRYFLDVLTKEDEAK